MDSNADMTTLQNADNDHEIHFAGTSPQIVVDGTAEEPYYNILYVDTITGETCVGFGSYELENVFQWLEEYFGETRAEIVDPDSYRPTGRWEIRGGKRYCTNCGKRACVTRDSEDFWYTVGTDYCPNCGAKMEG